MSDAVVAFITSPFIYFADYAAFILGLIIALPFLLVVTKQNYEAIGL